MRGLSSEPVLPVFPEPVSSIGVRFDRLNGEVRASCVRFDDSCRFNAPEVRGVASQPLPTDLLRQLRSLEREHVSCELVAPVTTGLTEIAVTLCEQLVTEAGDTADEILTVGVFGAGSWEIHGSRPVAYREHVNTATLAEQSGKTVVDDFPSRDLAQGGRGGPVEMHALPFLFSERCPHPGHRWRGLLDISPHVTHFSVLEPIESYGNREPVSDDVCVGSRLLSELEALSREASARGSQKATDTAIPELEQIWLSLTNDVPAWNPEGISPLPLTHPVKDSEYISANLPNLRATAERFIANRVAIYVRHRVSPSRPIGEILMMGEGARDGRIKDKLIELLPGVRIRQLQQLGYDRTVRAAAIATLALLNVCQVPLACTNRAEGSRVLGRITPGSPSNWHRVLRTMASHAPSSLPLRDAI